MADSRKPVSEISFEGTSSREENPDYNEDDVVFFKNNGATSLIQRYARHTPPEAGSEPSEIIKVLVGVDDEGNEMLGPDDEVALPCPPYCKTGVHPSKYKDFQGSMDFLQSISSSGPQQTT